MNSINFINLKHNFPYLDYYSLNLLRIFDLVVNLFELILNLNNFRVFLKKHTLNIIIV